MATSVLPKLIVSSKPIDPWAGQFPYRLLLPMLICSDPRISQIKAFNGFATTAG
jgi:hypothetical protein